MWPFRRRVKLEITDEEKAKKDFIKKAKRLPFSRVNNYKTFIHYHGIGEVYSPNKIYCLYQGQLLRIPR